jgi:hypothetical protein
MGIDVLAKQDILYENMRTIGFTRSQGPSRLESFWVNEKPRYLEVFGIPCAR